MSRYLEVHPTNPQARLIREAVDQLRAGGVVVYPTDSSYALGCVIGEKAALERIRRIRMTERDHDFTLLCTDLSEIASYARIDKWAYRLLRALTPGPYTFILKATSEVPKRLQDPKRRSIGIRVPDNRIAQALLTELGAPLMSSTLILPTDQLPLTHPSEIRAQLDKQVDVIVAGGAGGLEPTTVLDLSGGELTLIRQGKGDVSAYIDI
jgi:tRNA threonylcarbamoyl adenosine modification protein (Sua5/YciO/YrdC/YwlC family)